MNKCMYIYISLILSPSLEYFVSLQLGGRETTIDKTLGPHGHRQLFPLSTKNSVASKQKEITVASKQKEIIGKRCRRL